MAKEISTYTHDGMELPFEDWSNTLHSFGDLTSIIQTTHDAALSSTVKAINRMQTMRNWLIGYYIVEYEQYGKDRAEYGAKLLKKLEERVNRKGISTTLLKNSRSFYLHYPQMVENLVPAISPTVSGKLVKQEEKSPTVSDQFKTSGKKIISSLSFSHIVELLTLNDPLARYFYEQECIKCTWSVRELRRQISTNLYVRAGISANPDKLLSLPSVQGHDSAELQIRQPFTFEYALAGMDNQLFVSTYMLQLPDKKTLEEFLLKQLDKEH